ncbi:hypothetical protein HKX48_001523, partial [Thoreauomyces humboldtii]
TVTIAVGAFKGYVGIVKEVIDDIARVELHTASRVVNVDRSKVLRPGETMAPSHSANSNGGAYQSSTFSNNRFDSVQTPLHGSKTPMHGSRTPFAGGRTPGMDGGRTPFGGGRTPGMDGGRTPAMGMAGGRTPAMDMGRTPAWDAGSKTPRQGYAWDAGSRTPGRPVTATFASSAIADAALPGRIVPSGGNYADAQEAAPVAPTQREWPAPTLLVTLKSDPTKQAVITTVNPTSRTVTMETHQSTDPPETLPNVSFDDIVPVRPSRKDDKTMVLSGDAAGQLARLISAEESDGIIRLDTVKQIRIFPLDMIGMYV